MGVPRALLAMLLVAAAPSWAGDATETETGTDILGITAAGTQAGSTIVNDALVDYSVGSVPQDRVSASETGSAATFVVDRVLDVNVSRSGALKTGAGQDAYLAFDVTNESNDDLDVLLRAAQVTDGSEDIGSLGSSSAVATVLDMCIDNTAGGAAEVGVCGTPGDVDLTPTASDAAVFVLSSGDTEPGTAVRVLVQLDLGTAADGDFATFALAAALSGATAGASDAGDRINADSNGRVSPDSSAPTALDEADDPAVVQNVFGDDTGSDLVAFDDGAIAAATGPEGAFDGQHADRDQIQVATALLSVTKTSRVIYDPINGLRFDVASTTLDGREVPVISTSDSGSNPKAIPGAIVEYTITVANTGTATATDVTIVDDVPDDVSNGNDETVSGFTANADSVGLAGSGGASTTSADAPAVTFDRIVIASCSATPAADGSEADFTNLENLTTGGINIGDCATGESGFVTYYVTIP
ncbi:MAG: hypothetical protein V2J24_01090 [Pseudomonadales bacterium]|jgi:uncharacterized repeat protein (TIGR01451 family)|nr:hypothetical protein [Pseudomonadales bacterium]